MCYFYIRKKYVENNVLLSSFFVCKKKLNLKNAY